MGSEDSSVLKFGEVAAQVLISSASSGNVG